ncbi:MAG: DUF2059 domain-containing protein [Betaproteobacteria bacterium]|nr:DUF2059 domain-containing protein [Betaproteobacteria bacterium]
MNPWLAPVVLLVSLAWPAMANPPVAPRPAAAPVDAELQKSVKELLEAMNMRGLISDMTAGMRNQLPQMYDAAFSAANVDGKLTQEQRDALRKVSLDSQREAFEKVSALYADPEVSQGMEDIMGRAYARNFTIEELRAITAFYQSPAGQKSLKVVPRMMQQTMPEIMGLIMPRVQTVIEGSMKDFRAKLDAASKAAGAK